MGAIDLDLTTEQVKEIIENPLPVGTIIPFHLDVDQAKAFSTDFWVVCDDTDPVTITLPNTSTMEITNYDLTDDIYLSGSVLGSSTKSTNSSTSIPAVKGLDHDHTVPSHTHTASATVSLNFQAVETVPHTHTYTRFVPTSGKRSTGSSRTAFSDDLTSSTATVTPPSLVFDFAHSHTLASFTFTSAGGISNTCNPVGGTAPITKSAPRYFKCAYIMKIK